MALGKGRRLVNLALALVLAGLVGFAAKAADLNAAGAALAAGSLLADPAPAVQAAGRAMSEALSPEEEAAAEDGEDVPGYDGPLRSPEDQSGTPLPSPTPTPAPQEPAQQTPTPQPETDEAEQQTPPEGAGAVARQHYEQGSGDGYVTLPAGSIKNVTSLSDQEVARLAGAGLPFDVEVDSSEPQVLVMHTHATETYLLNDGSWYDPADTGRTTDLEANTVAVGAQLAQVLNEAGINTLHDETLHDYPSYVGSYERSNVTVRQYLEQYPSIKVVLDVHRDAIEKEGTRIAPVAQIGQEEAAQVMIICGCDNGGNLPNFQRNLAFAAAWESTMEGMFPGLTRPVLFDYRYYNQDLTTGSLLIEVGGHGNTLDQALVSGRLVGQALVRLFGAG